MIILPNEAKLLRDIEAKVVGVLVGYHFEEVLFPRLISSETWNEIASCLGGNSQELQSEVVRVSPLGGKAYTLCHWQCEPYYKSLQIWHDQTPKRVFDRSGWSYRNEMAENYFRPREFIRVEAVWRDKADSIAFTFDALLNALSKLLEREGLEIRKIRRDDEVKDSNQRDVVDLVCLLGNGSEIEVAGGHLHGSAFVKKFWPDAPDQLETACLGVSLTRITRLLLLNKNC